MAAYKRTDPKKLAQDREAIARDQAAREVAPAKPNLLQQGVNYLKDKISQNKRRRRGFGGVPQVKGAMQYGFKDPDRTA